MAPSLLLLHMLPLRTIPDKYQDENILAEPSTTTHEIVGAKLKHGLKRYSLSLSLFSTHTQTSKFQTITTLFEEVIRL